MQDKDINNLITGIQKTGFILEYQVSKILEQNGWAVLNNRYYIDDLKNIEREIDILAYKSTLKEDIRFYTCLIISTKKDKNCIWSFLTKDLDKNNPNINFYPIANWSNEKAIDYMLKNFDFKEFELNIKNNKNLKFLYELDQQIFAFQEMNEINGNPQDSKNIYNSIITIIKALEFEKNSLIKRKKNKTFYNFNLISIFEGTMVEMYFKNDLPEIKEIDDIKYLNRHIINNTENFFRVHFIKFDKFNEIIKNYNKLVSWNTNYYYNLFTKFFDIAFTNNESTNIYWKEFTSEIKFSVLISINKIFKKLGINSLGSLESLDYEYDANIHILSIVPIFKHENSFKDYDKVIDELNLDIDLKKTVLEALKKWYRYNYEFIFSGYSIPF